jgi:Xaa-Pro aminopeptidase
VVDFDDLFAELKQKYSVNKIGIVGELTFPQVIFGKMKKAFPQADIAPAEKILYEMRVSKSENELACIRKAGEIIDHTFEYALNRIKPGATELDVQADLMYMMLHLGAEDHTLSWAPMIPSGKENSNLCMNRNSMKKIEEGEIVNVDAGVLYEGYNAVICTPVILGKVPEEMRKAILTAWDASRTVANALKPGATSKQLFKIYADFLANTGYSKFSPYGSVHSLGMLECEPPFFSNKRDVILAENAVVAIDAYFANLPWGSFRIEDTFIVKSNGFEPVTKFNSEYLKRYL